MPARYSSPPPAYRNPAKYPPGKANGDASPYTASPVPAANGWQGSRCFTETTSPLAGPSGYRSTESTPLNRTVSQSKTEPGSRIWRILLVGVILGLGFWHYKADRSNTDRADVRDRIREEWKAERVQAHEDLTAELRIRELAFNKTLTNRISVFDNAIHARETQFNATLARRLDEFDNKITTARHNWEKEVREMSTRLEEWREKDRQRRESEERRIRTKLYWDDLTAQPKCIRYNTREYTARLMNVPNGEDALEWCKSTEIMIHGETYAKPSYCTIEYGKVLGHFTVTTNEPSCKPYFESFKNKGCTAPGSQKRRFEGFLGNFQEEDHENWREMCYSTPVDLWGQHFASPEHCANWGRIGIWGIWTVEDDRC